MEEQQKKRRGRPRKNPDDPKWLDKTEFDAEKAWKEQAKVVDKQQTEMVSEALQNAIKGTGVYNWQGIKDKSYYSEIWVPIKKK